MAVDVALRTATVLACGALTLLLFLAPRRGPSHLFGGMFCLGVVAFILTSAPWAGHLPVLLLVPLTALCVTKAGWFWLFAQALFRDGFRPARHHGVLLAVLAVYGLWQQLVYQPATGTSLGTAASLGFEAMVAVLALLALREAWLGMAVDLVERRRRIRLLFVVLAGAYLATAAAVQAHNLFFAAKTTPFLVHANLAFMFAMAAGALVSLVTARPASWLRPESAPAGMLTARERVLLERLRHAMEKERIYREEGLTIARLAARLSAREHQLRRVINRGLGFRNFNDFLHAYRIREASERLRRPEEADVPVLSIALDVGYSSSGPFNRAFKSRVGMTPSSFRRRAGATAAPASH